MIWFIVSLIMLAAGVLFVWLRRVFAASKAEGSREADVFTEKRAMLTIAGLILIIGGVFSIIINSYTIIPARNVGIVVTFGKADRSLDNGFHWVAPWSSVETIDATVKNVNHDSDTKNCNTVRLLNQTTACVDVTVQWNIDQKASANELWQKYRGADGDVVKHVQANVVERQLQKALNTAFAAYDPLKVISEGGGDQNLSEAQLTAHTFELLIASVPAGIVIDSVTIPLVHYDPVTQEKLNAFAQALADTRIATQRKQTATQVSEANKILAANKEITNTGVQYQNCLNLIADLAAKNQLQNLPTTFNCNVGSSGTPVIVSK